MESQHPRTLGSDATTRSPLRAGRPWCRTSAERVWRTSHNVGRSVGMGSVRTYVGAAALLATLMFSMWLNPPPAHATSGVGGAISLGAVSGTSVAVDT